MESFYASFHKIITYVWIQQCYIGRKQKYSWKRFYTMKKPLKNRAFVKLVKTKVGFFKI